MVLWIFQSPNSFAERFAKRGLASNRSHYTLLLCDVVYCCFGLVSLIWYWELRTLGRIDIYTFRRLVWLLKWEYGQPL